MVFADATTDERNVAENNETNADNDDVYNYATARLNLGLLIKCADDAVREGDGDRIILCWRFFLLYYKAFKHHKYALAAFNLLANVTALLTEEKAHSLTWNRTINNKGGKGKNESNDVRLEQWNCLAKELLSNLGVNLNEQCAQREANAIAFMNEILVSIDDDLQVRRPTGKHIMKKKEKDMKMLVEEFTKYNIFHFTPGRKYDTFTGFDRNILSRMKITALLEWLNDQRKKLELHYN